MVRTPCCEQMGLKKGPWTPEEDQILISFIRRNGHGNWRALPKQAGLLRCGKSCRLRWKNYLQPDIKRGNFSKEEEETIIRLHKVLGNRWSAIAGNLPGRTDNEIKNYWHTHLKKRLEQNINSTVPQSNETVQLQRDFSNEARIPSKPADNYLTTHKETSQTPESPDVYTPILHQQSQPELSDSISIEGTDASGIFSGSSSEGNIYMPRDFAATGGMNYGSSNVREFWYNILMQAAGNSREMQVNLEQFN